MKKRAITLFLACVFAFALASGSVSAGEVPIGGRSDAPCPVGTVYDASASRCIPVNQKSFFAGNSANDHNSAAAAAAAAKDGGGSGADTEVSGTASSVWQYLVTVLFG